jgi:hypothetical protein
VLIYFLYFGIHAVGGRIDNDIIVILARVSMATAIIGAFFGMVYMTFSAGRHVNQSFDHKEDDEIGTYGKL